MTFTGFAEFFFCPRSGGGFRNGLSILRLGKSKRREEALPPGRPQSKGAK